MWRGSLPALVTPMTPDGQIDYETLSALLEWHMESGSAGIVIIGTTGEGPTLSWAEREEVIRHTVSVIEGRLPVIAGTGTNCTQTTIELCQSAIKLGADACLVVTPYYNKPPQRGLYEHFKSVSQSIEAPIILYNVPSRTGCDLLPETVIELSKFPNILAIKEASGLVERVKVLSEALVVYTGEDDQTVDVMKLGAEGVISVTANVVPKQMAQLCRLMLEGHIEQAEQLNEKLKGLHHSLFVEANPIPVKWLLHRMGKINSGIRLPLVPLSSDYFEVVETALTQATN